jgi:hypothetical protein
MDVAREYRTRISLTVEERLERESAADGVVDE